MNIIEPYARLLSVADRSDGIELLRKIEWSGRISHRSEDAQTEDSWDRFIRAVVLGHGDWSMVEHASATVDARMDRGITHEWVRHRHFSFTQESTRFVNYQKKMPPSFVRPDDIPEATILDADWWGYAIDAAEAAYRGLLSAGCSPQIARSVLPNALSSRIVTTGNLRNWRYFFIMRTTKETHPQMRQISIPLLEEFQEKIPILFEDIVPMARQIDNLKLAG